MILKSTVKTIVNPNDNTARGLYIKACDLLTHNLRVGTITPNQYKKGMESKTKNYLDND